MAKKKQKKKQQGLAYKNYSKETSETARKVSEEAERVSEGAGRALAGKVLSLTLSPSLAL